MSIVICIVDRNKGFFIAADKRAIKNGIINDNYQKIYELKQGIYFGMTGTAEAGHEILNVIKKNTHLSASELIQLTNSIFQPNRIMLTIILAGLNEDGDFFIWQKNHEGEVVVADIGTEKIAFSINTNDNSELFRNYLFEQLKAEVFAREAITRTINFAAARDNSISSNYMIVEHFKAN